MKINHISDLQYVAKINDHIINIFRKLQLKAKKAIFCFDLNAKDNLFLLNQNETKPNKKIRMNNLLIPAPCQKTHFVLFAMIDIRFSNYMNITNEIFFK